MESGNRFLVIGSGGREHALVWRLGSSPACKGIWAAPGNPGMAQLATCLPISTSDFEALGKACLEHNIDTVVVGPEQPLVDGIADYFATEPSLKHIALLGPDKACAQLEGSKDFSKAFMARHQIPTASYATFTTTELDACLTYLAQHPLPIVLKADGLAAGKGVVICQSVQEAQDTAKDMLSGNAFGQAGERVVVEQFLDGWEMSYFLLADGTGHYLTLPQARDYKRIGEGNTGPNTGGMGTVSPVELADATLLQKVQDRIAAPSIAGLMAEGLHYKGFLFIGLMVVQGEPYVIEYNCRLGDPETQSIMSRLGDDFATAIAAAARGTLQDWIAANGALTISPTKAVTVILAAAGYPGTVKKGDVITGLDTLTIDTFGARTLQVFHAGTSLSSQGELITAGGRVIAATASAPAWNQAVEAAHRAAEQITWTGKQWRRDIGRD